jgi:hypothetical protein
MAETTAVEAMSDAERIGAALRRSLPKLGPEAREQIAQLLEPEVLAVIGIVLVGWGAAHFVGIGELIVILAVVRVFALGMAVFDGLEELFAFAAPLCRGGLHSRYPGRSRRAVPGGAEDVSRQARACRQAPELRARTGHAAPADAGDRAGQIVATSNLPR